MRKVRQRRFDQRFLAAFKDACDGAVLRETFAQVADGEISAAWRRQVQEHNGRPCGLAQVSRYFVGTPTLHLRDQRSHVAVWSASDDVLPLVQFDNGEAAGKPVTLVGLGQMLATGRDTDLRGIAFGSFRNGPHMAQDIHYANLKIGKFVDSEISRPRP